jgi:hypothetical protein
MSKFVGGPGTATPSLSLWLLRPGGRRHAAFHKPTKRQPGKQGPSDECPRILAAKGPNIIEDVGKRLVLKRVRKAFEAVGCLCHELGSGALVIA